MSLVWISCLALPVSAPAEAPLPLTAMTFNLRYASPTPPHSWPERRPVMRALWREAAPDVVGTQEGTYPQLRDLAADLPEYDWIGLGREGGSRGEFMAVLYRTERLEPLAFDHFWLSDTPETAGSRTWGNFLPRMATWVRFRDKRRGGEFYVVNTHLDHLSQRSREKSAELIRRRVEALWPELPVLLLGDFNAAAGDNKVYDLLVGPGAFADAWQTAARRGEAVGTFHGYRGPRKGGPRIDWILTRGPWQVEHAEAVTFAQDGQYPSDHFPVVARLGLGAE